MTEVANSSSMTTRVVVYLAVTAILKYLCTKFNVEDHWNPRADLKDEARINEYLHWHHANTRFHSTMVFRILFRLPAETKQEIDWHSATESKNRVSKVVKQLDKYYIQNKKYLCGNDISIADLLAVCELMQLWGIHEDRLYASNPNVMAWIERVKARLGPEFDNAHRIIYRLRDFVKKPIQPAKL